MPWKLLFFLSQDWCYVPVLSNRNSGSQQVILGILGVFLYHLQFNSFLLILAVPKRQGFLNISTQNCRYSFLCLLIVSVTVLKASTTVVSFFYFNFHNHPTSWFNSLYLLLFFILLFHLCVKWARWVSHQTLTSYLLYNCNIWPLVLQLLCYLYGKVLQDFTLVWFKFLYQFLFILFISSVNSQFFHKVANELPWPICHAWFSCTHSVLTWDILILYFSLQNLHIGDTFSPNSLFRILLVLLFRVILSCNYHALCLIFQMLFLLPVPCCLSLFLTS